MIKYKGVTNQLCMIFPIDIMRYYQFNHVLLIYYQLVIQKTQVHLIFLTMFLSICSHTSITSFGSLPSILFTHILWKSQPFTESMYCNSLTIYKYSTTQFSTTKLQKTLSVSTKIDIEVRVLFGVMKQVWNILSTSQ